MGSDGAFSDFNVDDTNIGQLNCHKVAGIYLGRAREFVTGVSGEEYMWQLLILLIILEPLSEVTLFFIRSAHPYVESLERAPPLMDCVTDRSSPIIICLQYISSLLLGSSGTTRSLSFAAVSTC